MWSISYITWINYYFLSSCFLLNGSNCSWKWLSSNITFEIRALSWEWMNKCANKLNHWGLAGLLCHIIQLCTDILQKIMLENLLTFAHISFIYIWDYFQNQIWSNFEDHQARIPWSYICLIQMICCVFVWLPGPPDSVMDSVLGQTDTFRAIQTFQNP